MNSFKVCGECIIKKEKVGLDEGYFYCQLADEKNILPEGKVHYTTDASECVMKGYFKSS